MNRARNGNKGVNHVTLQRPRDCRARALHPRFGDGPVPDRATPLHANLADFRTMADGEARHLAELAARVAPAPVVRVPFLAHDVHDLDTLAEGGAHLFAG